MSTIIPDKRKRTDITHKVLTALSIAAALGVAAFVWDLKDLPGRMRDLKTKHDTEVTILNKSIEKLESRAERQAATIEEQNDRIIILETRLRTRRN